jgi:NitT/TauT family transport system substrate-binding protein
MTKRRSLAAAVLVAIAAMVYASSGTASPGLIKINMGTEPWIGYAPWWIAQKEGFFAKNGLSVNIVNFQTDADRDSALIAGRTDVSNEPTNGIIRFDSTGKAQMRALIYEDASLGADAVLSTKSITKP